MSEWIELMKDVGFPVVVALFVLFRLEKSMKAVENALISMTAAVSKMEAKHD